MPVQNTTTQTAQKPKPKKEKGVWDKVWDFAKDYYGGDGWTRSSQQWNAINKHILNDPNKKKPAQQKPVQQKPVAKKW